MAALRLVMPSGSESVTHVERLPVFQMNRNPSPSDLRRFGTAMLVGFGIIGLGLWGKGWWGVRTVAALGWTGDWWQVLAIGLWVLGSVLAVLAWWVPPLGRRAYIAWTAATMPVGVVMTTLLLSLLFFLFLPVFAVVVRRKDPLGRRLHAGETYWREHRQHEATLERMRRLF
ncbi:MAG TPA: hypothetical protein PKK06_13025 [Phycisphaerae bacterium]|nr:hypothetical protein [Phycisphaerae bacterium]HNU44403.1 hypothetical protein [Phycisphaerae bacterium]